MGARTQHVGVGAIVVTNSHFIPWIREYVTLLYADTTLRSKGNNSLCTINHHTKNNCYLLPVPPTLPLTLPSTFPQRTYNHPPPPPSGDLQPHSPSYLLPSGSLTPPPSPSPSFTHQGTSGYLQPPTLLPLLLHPSHALRYLQPPTLPPPQGSGSRS